MRSLDKRDGWIAALLAVVFLLVTHRWIYQGGTGEADSTTVAVGIQQAVRFGKHMSEPQLYVPSGHPLYYLPWCRWSGAAALSDVIGAMAVVSWLSMAASIGLLHLICRRYARPEIAVIAVAATASSPVTFELGTYGHPVTPALLLFMIGACLLLAAVERASGTDRTGILLLALSALATFASVTTRADALFFLPTLVVLAHAARPTKRTLVVSSVTVGAALALAYPIWKALAPQRSGPSRGAVKQLVDFLANIYQPSQLGFGVASFCFAAGLGMCLLVAAAAVLLARRRALWPLLYGAGLVLHSFLMFVGNPHPSRHFLHAIFGCGLFLAVAAQELLRQRPLRGELAVVLVIAANLGVFPLAGAAGRGASIDCVAPTARCWVIQNSTQSLFERHRRNQRYFAWDQARWERLLGAPTAELFIGTWTEINGIRAWAAARGMRISQTNIPLGEGSEWMVVRLGDLKIFYWMRSPGGPTRPPTRPPGTAYIVAPFPPADVERLPRAVLEAPAPKDGFLAL